MANDVGTANVTPNRTVSAEVACGVIEATTLDFQVTVARTPGLTVDETLSITREGEPVEYTELLGPNGTRLHRVEAGPGDYKLVYRAEASGTPDQEPKDEYEVATYLRPSRYAEVDRFFGFAGRQFDFSASDADKALAVREFVADRLDYIPGSSTPFDGAAQTLLSSAGVCRDYAHLTIALLRALKVPARMVGVFPPGCDPMDFHAVAEAYVDGRWVTLDGTGLAPRATMLRVATGRDASDIAFLDNHGGSIRFDYVTVTATSAGDLPVDDPSTLVQMA